MKVEETRNTDNGMLVGSTCSVVNVTQYYGSSLQQQAAMTQAQYNATLQAGQRAMQKEQAWHRRYPRRPHATQMADMGRYIGTAQPKSEPKSAYERAAEMIKKLL